jgi:hypothetical protein
MHPGAIPLGKLFSKEDLETTDSANLELKKDNTYRLHLKAKNSISLPEIEK